MRSSIKLIEAAGHGHDCVYIKVEIDGKAYEFGIRNTFKDGKENETEVTILKSPELWYVPTKVFSYPFGD